MGKTFRRGGAERGYYSPGKSLRDKRQRGSTKRSYREDSYEYDRTKQGKDRKFEVSDQDRLDGGG